MRRRAVRWRCRSAPSTTAAIEGRIGVGRLHTRHPAREGTGAGRASPTARGTTPPSRKVYTFEEPGQDRGSRGPCRRHRGRDRRRGSRHRRRDHRPARTRCALEPIAVEEPTMAVVLRGFHQPARRPRRRHRRRPPAQGASHAREGEQHLHAHRRDRRTRPACAVAGRGVLHLSVLMETMRREGFEFQVGRPQRRASRPTSDGNKLEPIEEATVDVPNDYSGKAIEVMRHRWRRSWRTCSRDESTTSPRCSSIPSRGTMGLKTRILNATRGEAVHVPPLQRVRPVFAARWTAARTAA